MAWAGTGTPTREEIMALTRAQIKTKIGYNTGRGAEKAAAIETLCDEALKVAVNAHPFRMAQSELIDIPITEDATSVSLSDTLTSTLVNIITARIVDATGSTNTKLVMKTRSWWDENVINSEDNQKGRPEFGCREGTSVLLDRPAESNLELRIVVSQEQIFDSDSTMCPIGILDVFVVQYVTAMIFLSIENMGQFVVWKNLALGSRWDEGIVGGSLGRAIETDKFDTSEEFQFERSDAGAFTGTGVSILNQAGDHSDYGGTRRWF